VQAGLSLNEQPFMAQFGYNTQANKAPETQVQYDKKGVLKREKKDPWRHHGPKIKLMKERAEREALRAAEHASKNVPAGSTTRSTTTTTTVLATTTTTTTTMTAPRPPAFHAASARSAGVNSPYANIDIDELMDVVTRALKSLER
jgi:activator of HSP90 ATPase